MRLFAPLSVAAILAADPSALHGQCEAEERQLLGASDPTTNEYFGWSVDILGDTAVVGAQYGDGPWSDQGAVYVYQWDGAMWSESQELLASDGVPLDLFGNSVALWDDWLAIGVPGSFRADFVPGSGSVFLFKKSGNRYVEVDQIHNPTPTLNALFGFSVAMKDGKLAVGTPSDSQVVWNGGAVHMYELVNDEWQADDVLRSNKILPGDGLGFSVALEGAVVVGGAESSDEGGQYSGSAYVYRKVGANWIEEKKLLAPDPQASARFGTSVDVEGGLALIGAPGHDTKQGAAFLYRHDGLDWNFDDELQAYDGLAGEYFGRDVNLDGDHMLITASWANGVGAGYLLRHDGDQWQHQNKLRASPPAQSLAFGTGAALDGAHAILGAYELNTWTGAALYYEVDELTLCSSTTTPATGDPITITTCGGRPGSLNALCVMSVDLVPWFVPLTFVDFDGDGRHELNGVTPAGLAGLDITVQSLGFVEPGKARWSNPVVLEMQ